MPALLMVSLRSFVAVLCALMLVGLLLAGNLLLARRILRLEWPADPFATIGSTMTPVREPWVFVHDGYSVSADSLSCFAAAVGLEEAARKRLPATHPLFVDIAAVVRSNPYPPLLAEIDRQPQPHLSFGYLGVDSRYHQITFYGGESDTTPSWLVRKVHGPGTHGGDYFVRYTVFLSRPAQPEPMVLDQTGKVIQWSPIPDWPDLDHIAWSTFEGGSYNGFEEIEFVFVSTCAEILLIAGGLTFSRLRTRRRHRLEAVRHPGP